ncbi:uncharacterized protein [Malus domestica]|uniref:uncharacterized protein isoform X2 n=1 Tax=Malus domestica TaxID=3750 RepID=UPI00049925F7
MSDSSIIVLWSATPRPKRTDLKQFVQKSSLCSFSQIDASVAFHNPTTRTSVSTPPWWKIGKTETQSGKSPNGFKSETTTQEQNAESPSQLKIMSPKPQAIRNFSTILHMPRCPRCTKRQKRQSRKASKLTDLQMLSIHP